MSSLENRLFDYVYHDGALLNFTTTMHCDMECPICLSNCGPSRNKDKKIPIQDLEFYSNQPQTKRILLTGGEITSIGLRYFNEATNVCAQSGNKVAIKTNGKWTQKENSGQYMDVLYQLSRKYNDYGYIGDDDTLNICIDLSVGPSHENSVKYAFYLLRLFPDTSSEQFEYGLKFVTDTYADAMELKQELKYKGVRVDNKGNFRYQNNVYGKITVLDEIIRTGRAKKNNLGVTAPMLTFDTENDIFLHIKKIYSDALCLSYYPNGFVYLIDDKSRYLAHAKYKPNDVPIGIDEIVSRLAKNLQERYLNKIR